MLEDPDVYRAASLLIDRHGEGALAIAATRAERLFRQGDLVGWSIWRTIVKRLRNLLTAMPAQGELAH